MWIGDWEIRRDADVIVRDGVEVRLTPRSMDVLNHLAERAGRVVSADELLDVFWRGTVQTDRAVYKAVAELRKALGDDARDPAYIKTVPKRGYSLIASVKDDLAVRPVQQSEHPTKSIAVLPFKNIDGNPENQFLVEGIAEALLDGLAKLTDLNVASRIDSFKHSGVDETAIEIGEALGVDHLLEGSVQRAGDRLRVTAQLIRAKDGFHLYSDQFGVDAEDIFGVQDQVANSVVDALRVHLDEEQRRQMLDWGTANVDAYLLVAKGVHHLNQRSPSNVEEAIRLFLAALDLDADFMGAYVQVARSINQLVQWVSPERGDELRDLFDRIQRKAINRAPEGEAVEHIREFALEIPGKLRMPTQIELRFRERILSHPVRSEGRAHGPTEPGGDFREYGNLLTGARLYGESIKYLELGHEEPDSFRRNDLQGVRTSLGLRKIMLERRPNDPGLLIGQVAGYAILKDFAQAEAYAVRLERADTERNFATAGRLWLRALRGDLAAGSAALEEAISPNPNLNHTNGMLCFIAGDVERGAHYWRGLSNPSSMRTVHREAHRVERGTFAPNVATDPCYHELLEDLGIGKTWQRHMMEGVMELEPVTGVKLSDRAREHYEADRFMIPAIPLSP